jgi:hypothetical protein
MIIFKKCLKIKILMRDSTIKKKINPTNFYRLSLILVSLLFLQPSYGESKDAYKLSASYSIPKKTKNLKLRVTEIPQEFDWIEKDLDGKTIMPKQGSLIVFETIETVSIYSSDGSTNYLPAGTKFWAHLDTSSNAKSFHREGKIKLDFFQAQIPIDFGGSKTSLENVHFDSQANSSVIKNSLKSISEIGAYSIGGALAAPLITLSISGSSLLGIGMLSNPYVLAGSSTLGGAAGLIYGIKKNGTEYTLEPGTEIKLDLKEPWRLEDITLKSSKEPIALNNTNVSNSNFKLNILEVSKTKDLFEDKAIKIKLYYENLTKEKLFYSDFVLVDSMGKEFYNSKRISDDYSIDGLPPKGNLELVFASNFIKAVHKLQIRRSFNQDILAEHKILIK